MATKVVLVMAIALAVGVLSYCVAYTRSGDQRVQESIEHLDDLVANNPDPELTHAWYEEPINVAFAGATITLAFGGFALMLEHARVEELAWPGTVRPQQMSEEATSDRAMSAAGLKPSCFELAERSRSGHDGGDIFHA